MKLCYSCLGIREEGDFYGKVNCYKCVYKEKVASKSDKVKLRKCRICGALLLKSRWKYCDDICSAIGHKQRKEEFWKRNLRDIKLD
jgi:NMD protein affecting ribosome stability and mRNA decay